MLRKLLLSLTGFFALSLSIYASVPLVLTDGIPNKDVQGLHMDILEDSTGKLTFNEIIRSTGFQPNHESYRYAENHGGNYWIRFKVDNRCVKENKWVLDVFAHHTQFIRAYIPNPKGSYNTYTSGQQFNFSQRQYLTKNIVFDIPSISGKNPYIYLLVKSDNDAGFEYQLRNQHYFTQYTATEYYILGIFYGILLVSIIYNLLLFIHTKDKVNLLYSVYIISCFLVSFEEDGLGFQYIWYNYPEFNRLLSHYISSISYLVSFILYSKYFLEIPKHYPKLNVWINISTIFYVVSECLFNVELVSNITYLIPFSLVYFTSVLLYFNGYKPSRFYVLGYSLVIISIIIIRLRWDGIIPSNIFTVYVLNLSIILEVVVLTYALGDKLKLITSEKNAAKNQLIQQLEENRNLQNKVNRELELKVSERTKTLQEKTLMLEEANLQLEELTKQLNHINSQLDFDNWQLNKKVSEETKSRIVRKEVSYEEFIKIFPDENTCLRYIEEIKWSKEYECKKCGNTKYTEIPRLISRRCSKCSYIESVTSGTLFHAIKFPLNKAFYIVYSTINRADKLTIDELSELLDLRRNTCWNFRKKVLERKEDLMKATKTTEVSNWEKLVLEVVKKD